MYAVYLRLSSKIAFRDDKKFAKIEVPTPLEIHIFFSSSKVHFNKLFGVKTVVLADVRKYPFCIFIGKLSEMAFIGNLHFCVV